MTEVDSPASILSILLIPSKELLTFFASSRLGGDHILVVYGGIVWV